MKFLYPTVFLAAAIICFAVFWKFVGHNLTYDVSSGTNGEYIFSHSEDLSQSGRVIISTFVSLAAAIAVTVFTFIIKVFRVRWFYPGRNTAEQGAAANP